MSIAYSLGPTSATEVTFYPGWDYTSGEEMDRTVMRSRTGKLYTYKWSDTKTIEFKVNYFDNSDAAIVNSWWDSQTELIWFVNQDGTTECTSVMLMNKEAPFREYQKPYTTKFQGVIKLEEYL